MIREVQVYAESSGNRWTPSRARRYWRQSGEAEAAGFDDAEDWRP